MTDSCPSSNEYPSVIQSLPSIRKDGKACGNSSYTTSRESSDFKLSKAVEKPRIDLEKYKTILKKTSFIKGKNLYDYIVDIVNRIIDERPTNVTDYFEQFSRNLQKYTLSEMAAFKDPQFLAFALSVIEFLKIKEETEVIEEENDELEELTSYHSSKSTIYAKLQRFSSESENIIQHMHFFGFCGLGFHIDEAFQLSLAVQKVQLHRHVENARFWGKIFGQTKSYYIVEAQLTRVEIEYRVLAKKRMLIQDFKDFIYQRDQIRNLQNLDDDLIPGGTWQNYPKDQLSKMKVPIAPIPMLRLEKTFKGIEEQVGKGLNRKTYFVTTSLSKDWIELPTVSPKQIHASKIFKKHFTGNLNLNLEPSFPGSERNYLRAMIARISAGTFIAPVRYYRRMTRKELQLYEDDVEVEEVDGEEEEEYNNDTPITENKDYEGLSLEETADLCNWVHCKPNILDQGRIIHFDEESAIKKLEKQVMTLDSEEEYLEEFENMEELEEEEDFKESYEAESQPETGPELFSRCAEDINSIGIPCWSFRYSSVYHKTNQMILISSNLWPGAYAYAFEKFSDCIYIGWGFKYVVRHTYLPILPPVEMFDYEDSMIEQTDPSWEMEERWRKYHEKKCLSFLDQEEMSELSVEFDADDEND